MSFRQKSRPLSPFVITSGKNILEIGQKAGNEGQSISETGQQENSESVI
jgi:hypothetical protein